MRTVDSYIASAAPADVAGLLVSAFERQYNARDSAADNYATRGWAVGLAIRGPDRLRKRATQ